MCLFCPVIHFWKETKHSFKLVSLIASRNLYVQDLGQIEGLSSCCSFMTRFLVWQQAHSPKNFLVPVFSSLMCPTFLVFYWKALGVNCVNLGSPLLYQIWLVLSGIKVIKAQNSSCSSLSIYECFFLWIMNFNS